MEHKQILEMLTKGGVAAVLLYIIVHFGGQYMSTMTEMQKDILQIRIELTKLQNNLLSRDDIEKMVDSKVGYHEARYHSMTR